MFSVQRRADPLCGKRSDDRERPFRATPIVFAIAPESAFTISPELCSELTRNRVRLQPGMAFTIDRIPHQHYQRRFHAGDPIRR